MNGKIVWSNLITPGVTVAVLQVDYNVGVIMLDQQLWCEAHQRKCDKFGFGLVHRAPLNDGFFIEPTPVPWVIP